MAGTLREKRRGLFSRQPEQHGSFAMIQPQLTRLVRPALRTVDDGVDRGTITDDAWQRDSYKFSKELGEVGSVHDISADTLAQGDFRLEQWDSKKSEWIPSKEAKAVRVLSAFIGPRGGVTELKRRAGMHLAIAGEAYLVGTPSRARGDNIGIVWEFISTEELRVTFGTDQVERRRDGTGSELLGKDTYMARLWKADAEYCADEATEILTLDGWKSHRDLLVGDEVLTLNHETGLSEWQPISAVNRFDVVDAEMRSMESKSHSSLTTMAHRWPVTKLHSGNRDWTTSAELTSADCLVTAAPCGDLPTEAKWSDAFVELVAWWWTEGDERGVIGQSAKVNPSKVDRIRACLAALFGNPVDKLWSGWRPERLCDFDGCGWPHKSGGLCGAHDEQRRRGLELRPVARRGPRPAAPPRPAPAWSERHVGDMVHFAMNRAATDLLRDVAPSRTPSLTWLRSLTRAQLELFIQTSIDADGHRFGNSSSLTQKDYDGGLERAEAFAFACVLAGYAPRLYHRTSGRAPTAHVAVTRSARVHVDRIRGVERYTGTVWCPTTPNGTWMARRGGKVFFTGNSLRADSPMRRVLPICRQIQTLDNLITVIAQSRSSAGVFYLPEEMSFASEDDEATDTDDDGDDDGIDEFSKAFLHQLIAPTENWSSVAKLLPLLMRGPADIAGHPAKDVIGLIDLKRDLEAWVNELRQAALHRLTTSLPIPPEVLEGKGGLNHWVGSNVDNDFITKYIKPQGDLLADFVTVAYLRPMLEIFENMSATESGRFRVVYDNSRLKGEMDLANNTVKAFDRKVAGEKAMRQSLGIDESAAPEPAEIAARNAMELLPRIPFLAPVLLPKIPGFEDIDPDVVADLIGGVQDTSDPLAAGLRNGGRPNEPGSTRERGSEAGKSVGDAPEPAGPGGQGGRQPMTALIERLVNQADAAMERAFERAGTQLVSAAVNKKDPTLRDRLAGSDKLRATSLITATQLSALGLTPDKLLDHAWDRFSLRARAWVRDHLEAEGVDGLLADDRAAIAVSALCSALDEYAHAFLHRGLPSHSNGLRVPDQLVVDALSGIMLVTI